MDSLRRRFLTKRRDIARFVADIRHIYVDEPQADFFQLGFHVAGNRLEEFIPVCIDLFDVHRRDHKTQLAEDDILGKLLYLVHRETQQAFRRVLHHALLRRDPHRKDRRHVDSDILARERVFQVYLNGKRRQVQILVCLDYGPYERRAAMDTF